LQAWAKLNKSSKAMAKLEFALKMSAQSVSVASKKFHSGKLDWRDSMQTQERTLFSRFEKRLPPPIR
jgi:hypothetical protein